VNQKKKDTSSMPVPDHSQSSVVTTTVTTPPPATTSSTTKPRRRNAVPVDTARNAADLAERTIHDPELAKQLLLSMALVRENPRTPPASIPGPGHVLPDGFFWAKYPPLESVLKKHMPEYYRLSMEMCQSVNQQAFNNCLVEEVRAAATERGWTFDPVHFGEHKVLRDRIRCYYKTHIQNAKKRLKTMLRNPTKRSNAINLMQHYALIEKAAAAQKIEKAKKKRRKKSTTTGDESTDGGETKSEEDDVSQKISL